MSALRSEGCEQVYESNPQCLPVRHPMPAASRRLALYSDGSIDTKSRGTQPNGAESRTVAGKAADVRDHCVAGLASQDTKKSVGCMRDLRSGFRV